MSLKKSIVLTSILGIFCLVYGFQGAYAKKEDIKFSLPINCTLGTNCYILNYFDLKRGEGVQDYKCGHLAKEAHKGIDIGFRDDQIIINHNIEVYAAADGKVEGIRNHIIDKRLSGFSSSDIDSVSEHECGNGARVSHGGGWETQYCHLKQGSIVVKEGQKIKRGDLIGYVGSSGQTTYPHLHISYTHNGYDIDPFVGLVKGYKCGQPTQSILDFEHPYKSTDVIRHGFSDHKVDAYETWYGNYPKQFLDDIPEFYFWVYTFGKKTGDKEIYKIYKPGNKYFGSTVNEVTRNKQGSFSYFAYTAKSKLATGTWKVEYELQRNGTTLLTAEDTLEIVAKKPEEATEL